MCLFQTGVLRCNEQAVTRPGGPKHCLSCWSLTHLKRLPKLCKSVQHFPSLRWSTCKLQTPPQQGPCSLLKKPDKCPEAQQQSLACLHQTGQLPANPAAWRTVTTPCSSPGRAGIRLVPGGHGAVVGWGAHRSAHPLARTREKPGERGKSLWALEMWAITWSKLADKKRPTTTVRRVIWEGIKTLKHSDEFIYCRSKRFLPLFIPATYQ